MHLKRVIVAVVFLPALYFYIMYLPSWSFFFLLTCATVIALSEFYTMYHIGGLLRYSCLFFGLLILSVSYFLDDYILNIIVLSVMAIICMRLFVQKNPLSSLRDISSPIIGLLYIPVFLAFQLQIREFGPEWIIFLYASVWLSDTLAYYVGSSFGRRRLYKEVSPNKTIAGAVGSIFGGITAAILLKATLLPMLPLSTAVIIGGMIGFISIIGDLVESMFKRDAGVKDSSIIIPGHGGVLDKIDGILFAGPVLYWLLTTMSVR